MSGIEEPNQWTSEYNNRFRDRRSYISPNPGQPMYHFSDAYDPSHFDGFNHHEAQLDTSAGVMTSGGTSAYKELAEAQAQAAQSSPPISNTTANFDESRNKFHVPGYGGFVKGKQFRHGDTYGKATRKCLDVPSNLPLEN